MKDFDPFDPNSMETVDVEDTLSDEEALELISQSNEHLGFEAEEIEEEEVEVEEAVEEVEEVEEVDETQHEIERIKAGFIADLQEKRQTIRQLQDFINTRLNQIAQPKQEEVEKPVEVDPEEDPVGYLSHKIDKRFEDFESKRQEEATRQFEEDALGYAAACEQDFVAEHPDYYEKLSVVRSVIGNAMRARGLPKWKIDEAVNGWEQSVIGHSYINGYNPAERVYQEAVKMEEQLRAATSGGNVTPVEQPQAPSSDKMQRTKAGAQKQTTLSHAKGGAKKGEMNLQDVLNLPEKKRMQILLNHDLSEKLFAGGSISRLEVQ